LAYSPLSPLALLVDAIFIHPLTDDTNSLSELGFLVCGIPILIFNLWAWIYPEIVEFYFFGKQQKEQRD